MEALNSQKEQLLGKSSAYDDGNAAVACSDATGQYGLAPSATLGELIEKMPGLRQGAGGATTADSPADWYRGFRAGKSEQGYVGALSGGGK